MLVTGGLCPAYKEWLTVGVVGEETGFKAWRLTTNWFSVKEADHEKDFRGLGHLTEVADIVRGKQ